MSINCITFYTRVLVATTPQELREIADSMERKIKYIQPGESKSVFGWYGKDMVVEIIIDQERIESEEENGN